MATTATDGGGSEFDDRFPPPLTSNDPGDSSGTPLLVSGTGAGAGGDAAALSIGAIVGITLAAVVGLLLLLGVAFRVHRKKRLQRLATTKRDFELHPVETPYSGGDAYAGYFRSDTLSVTGAGGRRLHDNEKGGDEGDSAATSGNNRGGGKGADESSLWSDDQVVALRIPLEKVELGALVSRGGLGEVYAGAYSEQRVAVKMLLPHARRDVQQVDAFLAEAKLLAALEHPRIVGFVGVAWESLADLCVVSEFMDGGDLRALLTRFEVDERRPHGFDHDKVKIAFHVAHALSYLHSLEPVVLHRDLKSRNVLLDAEFNAKLTDFGVTRERSDAATTMATTTKPASVGASLWTAPEVMMGERYDDKADVFSLGVVLSELDSHQLPYAHARHSRQPELSDSAGGASSGLTDAALLQLVAQGRVRVELSANAPQALVDLAAACTELEPALRPTAVDATYKLQQALRTYENFVF